ncbi:MAG: hypothetical protein JXA44_08500 [Methanospirillaceae archaeon]|nr:hypothetical protein [Methanospirillaceae archaeon]
MVHLRILLLMLTALFIIISPALASDTHPFPGNTPYAHNMFQDLPFGSFLAEFLGPVPHYSMDFSYGNETVFDMVEQSLYAMITALAGGETEDFFDIPLVKETLIFSNTSIDDVLISPDDVTKPMPALSAYQKFREQS